VSNEKSSADIAPLDAARAAEQAADAALVESRFDERAKRETSAGVRSMARWTLGPMIEGDRRDAAQFNERARGDNMRNLIADGWPEWTGFTPAPSSSTSANQE
jgi:hypothetical protein